MATTRIVGYLHNTPTGLEGERGSFANYILAANGLFISAESPLLNATVLVARAEVRGLAPLQEGQVEIPRDRIPNRLWDQMLSIARWAYPNEVCMEVLWARGDYVVGVPRQEATAASVQYHPSGGALLTIHSHAGMGAFFSGTDDRDEQGLGVYGVVGHVNEETPTVGLRVGVYGHFWPIPFDQVFGG